MSDRAPALIALAALGAALAARALACDGEPPLLINKDALAHAYVLTCNKQTTRASIAAGARQSLEGKSGCLIALGASPAIELHTEMECVIEAGALSCDLL